MPEINNPRDLEYSRPFNETLWSSHWALDELVQLLFDKYFSNDSRKATKRILKVVLVNLYAVWSDDPEMCLAVFMSAGGYKAKSRYNPNRVSSQVIEVVNRLADNGWLMKATGFNDRQTGIGRLTRIWPSTIMETQFTRLDACAARVDYALQSEPLVLRDKDRKDIEYQDTPETERMRSVLRDYNALLADTFIDIPQLEAPRIPLEGDAILNISQHDKFVRRVFNRGSWDKGGRFFGGWWQRCPKHWRQQIFMNDHPTIEDDYSGLHIVMLYGWEGLDYWELVGPDEDPYQIDVPDFIGDGDLCRAYAKGLMLMAVNAENERAAFQAFRSGMKASNDDLGKHLKDAQLKVILDALRKKHKPIAQYFGAGAGIDLMNKDSQITEIIIKQFLMAGRPILTIHDSYIVTAGDDGRLRDALQSAFAKVTGIQNIHLKRVGIGFHEVVSGKSGNDTSSDTKLEALQEVFDQPRSPGYMKRLLKFHSY